MSNNHVSIKDITLQISIEEANIILEALGQMPFIKVYALISKIQEQAGQQVNTHETDKETKHE